MHQYFHTTFGFCLWDILALIVFLVMAVTLIGHIYKQKKRQNKLEDELEEQNKQMSEMSSDTDSTSI